MLPPRCMSTPTTKKTREPRRRVPKPNAVPLELRPLAVIARMVRQRREELGWTFVDAAAWCKVGTRFLVDLEMGDPMLRFEKVLQVAHKLGIRIEPSMLGGPRAEVSASLTRRKVEPPLDSVHPQEWLALHHAGLHVARACGINAVTSQVVHIESGPPELHILGPVLPASCTSLAESVIPSGPTASRSPFAPASWHEEAGGPGFPAAIAFLSAHSAVPIRDIQQLTRWIVLSNALLDTEHHLGRWLVCSEGDELRLAPLSAVFCGSKFFTSTPHRGLRVGRAWPDRGLRVDHLVDLAEVAGIHPKVVFQYMRELALRVPGELDRALLEVYSADSIPAFIMEVVLAIRVSCARIGELVHQAENQLQGLKNGPQPKVTKVPPEL